MIKSILVINNYGKARLLKFYGGDRVRCARVTTLLRRAVAAAPPLTHVAHVRARISRPHLLLPSTLAAPFPPPTSRTATSSSRSCAMCSMWCRSGRRMSATLLRERRASLCNQPLRLPTWPRYERPISRSPLPSLSSVSSAPYLSLASVEFWGEDTKLIYRCYATLYFVFVADESESELGMLDLIQVLVELLDQCFENVCELDLIFHCDKVHCIVDEMVMGGLVLETRLSELVSAVCSNIYDWIIIYLYYRTIMTELLAYFVFISISFHFSGTRDERDGAEREHHARLVRRSDQGANQFNEVTGHGCCGQRSRSRSEYAKVKSESVLCCCK